MSALHINKSELEALKEKNSPILLDFYANWCGPCKLIAPVIDQIADENPQYIVAKVNVDEEPELAQEFGVFSIPSLIVIKDGKVKEKAVGAKSKAAILALLEG